MIIIKYGWYNQQLWATEPRKFQRHFGGRQNAIPNKGAGIAARPSF
jgi:hypothetical protein